MTTYEWLMVLVVVPAAVVLVAIGVGWAARMPVREARQMPGMLVVAVAVMMVIQAGELLFQLHRVPVVGFVVVELVGFAAACIMIQSFIVGMTLLFRPRLRGVGAQLVVLAALAMWWLQLVVSAAGP